MSGLEIIGPLIAGAASGLGAIAAGNAANANAKFEAQQMEMRGKEELAASQREAEMKKREGRLINSRQQALAAASGAGAGADAPTIIKLMADTAGQAQLNAASDLYGGRQRKAGLMDSAKGRRLEGRASLLGGYLGGFGQMAGGLGKAFG